MNCIKNYTLIKISLPTALLTLSLMCISVWLADPQAYSAHEAHSSSRYETFHETLNVIQNNMK
jgi:hypothetical protein